MKKMLLLLAFLAGSLFAGAQKVYFLYVQSDNGAPFYVRLGEKVYSSSASGYVILSSLRDSSYVLQVGFAGQNTESRFPVALNREDHGFVLKQVGGAWNLFDLQSLSLIRALAAVGPTEAENEALLAAADPFTRMLVQASDDMALLQAGPSAPSSTPSIAATPAQAGEQAALMPVPIRTAVPEVKATTAVFISESTPVAKGASLRDTIPAVAEPSFSRSLVTRRSESSTTEGFGLVFIDKQGDEADTIRLLIPNLQTIGIKNDPQAAPVIPVSGETPQQPKATAVVVQPMADSAAHPAPASIVPADCRVLAEEKDFMKLRKNMAAASDEGEMVSIARKNFKGRCYTSDQVRYLSALFLTALGKYNFFEAAKGHLSNPDGFTALGSELKDEYFIKRFAELSK